VSVNSDVRGPAALVPFSDDDLVAEAGSQLHPSGGLRIEVVGSGHSAAAAVRLASGLELVERLRSFDRGLVDTLGLVDAVHGSVRSNCVLQHGARGRVVCVEVLYDAVLDDSERASGPSNGPSTFAKWIWAEKFFKAEISALSPDPSK
jgi:hypothetical protein